MTPRLIGIGAIFIDDIVLPDGRTYMGQLGGGVVHALMGAAVWDERPGIVALAGQDLPVSIRQRLGHSLDIQGLHFLELPQMRAWQVFETDGTRRELYRVDVTEPFVRGAQPVHLPDSYRGCQACYLLQGFDGIETWCQTLDTFILWEPLQQIMIRENRSRLREVLKTRRIDLISPNLAEARAVYGLDTPEGLISALLEDGAQAAALRMGTDGSLVASQQAAECEYIAAVPVATIVDQTGAGNTFCGALLTGIIQGKSLREAALMGAVAASFCLEHRGVLEPAHVSRRERDRRYHRLIR